MRRVYGIWRTVVGSWGVAEYVADRGKEGKLEVRVIGRLLEGTSKLAGFFNAKVILQV